MAKRWDGLDTAQIEATFGGGPFLDFPGALDLGDGAQRLQERTISHPVNMLGDPEAAAFNSGVILFQALP